jgi:uncharacterized membrane protein YjgN (DUF898 family)
MDGMQEQGGAERREFAFTGEGGEYFRIWIVNLLLSIITLGIYSAWAKVRREQYFHRNTVLDGSALEYHGQPLAILKGRLLIVGLLAFNNVAGGLSPILAALLSLAFVIGLPWIICQAIRFRAWNTSWRGVHLGFVGTYRGMARVYFLNGLLVALTLGLAAPWWLNRFQRYIFSNLRFGGESFDAEPPVWDYYKPLLVLAVVFVAGLGLVVGGFFASISHTAGGAPSPAAMSTFSFTLIMFYVVLYLIGASYVKARLANALWNHTRVGEHQFRSSYSSRKLFILTLSNSIGIVLSLGLFLPFAKVRLARYRAQTMALESDSDLDSFVAQQEQQARAFGDQAAELLDVDLGF